MRNSEHKHYTNPNSSNNQSNEKNQKKSNIVDFSNGLFQGIIKNDLSFDSEGILIMDDGLFYTGNLNNDNFHGKGLLVFPNGGFYIGDFFDNKMNGNGLIIYSSGKIIKGTFKQSRLCGSYLLFKPIEKKWCECSDDKEKITTFTHNIQSYFSEFFSNKNFMLKNSFSTITKSDKIFIGFTKNSSPHGLGIWINTLENSNKIIEYGEYKDGVLHGIGKRFDMDFNFYDGFLEEGEYSGIGIYYQTMTESFIYGIFNNGNIERTFERGQNLPIDLILLFKKNRHLKSERFLEKKMDFFKMGLDLKIFGEMFYISSKHNNYEDGKIENFDLTINKTNQSKQTQNADFEDNHFRNLQILKDREMMNPKNKNNAIQLKVNEDEKDYFQNAEFESIPKYAIIYGKQEKNGRKIFENFHPASEQGNDLIKLTKKFMI